MVTAGIAASVTDEELAAAAAHGDRNAFVHLAERYRRLAFGCAYALVGSREDAEDAVQESLVRAYQSLRGKRVPRCWAAWYLRILRNYCRDLQRRQQVRREGHDTADCAFMTPEQVAAQNERAMALQQAVDRLPESLRLPVVLHYGYGLTYQEIALALDVRPSTVTGRIAGALRRLRRSLSEEVFG